MTQNRRHHERTAINLRARWEGVSGQQECRVSDLAMGGCFVDSMSRVEIGEVILLEIELPSGEWFPLRSEVTTYHEGVGFGLQFKSLTKTEDFALRKLVK